MQLDRRSFISLATGAALVGNDANRPARARGVPRYRAVAFDGLAIFDPRSVATLAEARFPGRGGVLMDAWRTKQFEYQWLRALGGPYADFMQVTADSLRTALAQARLTAAPSIFEELVGAYASLPIWGDVRTGLARLHDAGVRMALLSNMTADMLGGGLDRAGLRPFFDHVLSTDVIRGYKPDPKAYALGLRAFGLRREDVLFVPFAGWDMAGATWFGYPAFWLNRSGAPLDTLDVGAHATGPAMADLTAFVLP